MTRKTEMPEDVRRMTAEMRKAHDNPDPRPQLRRGNPKAVSAAEDKAMLEWLRDKRGSQSDDGKHLTDAAEDALASAAFAGAGEIIRPLATAPVRTMTHKSVLVKPKPTLAEMKSGAVTAADGFAYREVGPDAIADMMRTGKVLGPKGAVNGGGRGKVFWSEGRPWGVGSRALSEGSAILKTPVRNVTNGRLANASEVEILTRQAAKGGNTRGESGASEVPSGGNPVPDDYRGPRIVINPTTFSNRKDALCVAFDEGFRIIMEANGFDPVAEPTDKQRKFFSDTEYANDELMLRRTILARICTFDTSIDDATDEQLQEALEFLDAVLEAGFCKTQWEQWAVSRIKNLILTTQKGKEQKE